MPLNDEDRRALVADIRRVREATYYESPDGIAECGFTPCGDGEFTFGSRLIRGHPKEDQRNPWRFNEMPVGGKLDVLDTYINWSDYRERGLAAQEERGLLFEASRDEGRPPIRDTTRDLVESVMLDAWPRNAAVVDFGIDSQRHYEALYYPIREGEITPEDLDVALGHGKKLTELTRNAPSNPHKDVTFHTSWDVMFGRRRPDAGVRSDRLDATPGGDADEKTLVIRELFDLATEAGYPGFRREYFDDPDLVREWPDPAVRETELRAIWQGLSEQHYPEFERGYAPASAHEIMRQADSLRAVIADPESRLYERACAAGRQERADDPLDVARRRARVMAQHEAKAKDGPEIG